MQRLENHTFMELPSAVLDLLHKRNGGAKRRILGAAFRELTQTVTTMMYYAADCCLQRDSVTVMLNVLL